MAEINWWKISNQNLALAVRRAGFDLTMYDQYSKGVQNELCKKAIKESLQELKDAFKIESGRDIAQIKRGVYVICLSSPFSIQYDGGLSEIIYIGQGNILHRLKGHYERSLFRFMQSLSGTNFDFYISEPKKPGGGRANHYHKHIEYELLKSFSEKIGSGEKKFPLLNKYAGANKKLSCDKGWDKPLKKAGKKPQWGLVSTKFWNFESLD